MRRVVLVTDFGSGLYVGQMLALLRAQLRGLDVIDLVHDLPAFRPDLAAYLLPGLVRDMPCGSLYLCVVDPGVGGHRDALCVHCGENWFIGPDNGVFSQLGNWGCSTQAWRIGWRPARSSATFHGRDWFVPAAVRHCLRDDLKRVEIDPGELVGAEWPTDKAQVIYVDRFGNLITGVRASGLARDQVLLVKDQRVHFARTFSDVPMGELFWFENAFGLVELAVNQGRADALLGLLPGDACGSFEAAGHLVRS